MSGNAGAVRFGSVCSGIEAASVAWHPLGWRAAWLAEVDKFPSTVLAHHYPGTPNLGDITAGDFAERAGEHGSIDVLVGGTPCQSFSVAGLRAGLADPRGNLALVFLAIADRLRPAWVVWENVPGVLSSGDGRDFGAFLGALGELGYGWSYRVLDAQYFGVAQRRRRVFVVGHLGDWRRAAAVLFERDGLSGNPPPRRTSGARVASCLESGTNGTGGTRPPGTTVDTADSLVAYRCHGNNVGEAGTLRGGNGGLTGGVPFVTARQTGQGWWTDDGLAGLRSRPGGLPENLVAHALRADGFDASEDGTGRGTPLVPVAYALGSHAGAAEGDQTNRSHASGGPVGMGISEEMAHSLRGGRTQTTALPMTVRRLTPRECERLQGFPDDYTAVPYRDKPAADGPRYKALGNSMAVPVMRWIGNRIAAVSEVTA